MKTLPKSLRAYLNFFLLLLLSSYACKNEPGGQSLEAQVWDKVTLSFEGPETTESAEDNPFLNYRLMVTLKNGDKTITLPGFYAANGNAAESGSIGGNIWQVRFRPDEVGEWTYTASFRKGESIAISDDPNAGEGVAFDGETGTVTVSSDGKQSNGRLIVGDGHYLHYASSGEAFLKGGADSPENFLAYEGFDETFRRIAKDRSGEANVKETLHKYEPHLGDWKTGDPTWKGDKGKGIIGALNYLASEGMNSVYFLTMNIEGDGEDVWPYTAYEERFRFDCSKLDQWEVVFDHMDKLGLMLHIVTQETENELLLDNGDTGPERKIYYRELIARFAHHMGVTWNLGEENGPAPFTPNGQTIAQQKAMAKYIKTHDPYKNYLVIHTHAAKHERHEIFNQLVGDPHIDGMSVQVSPPTVSHEETKLWREKSTAAGNPWTITIDEIGPASIGIDPDDKENNNQDTIFAEVLWGNLMAGGGGVEWYFGYKNHNNDLQCEDWRSRDQVWDETKLALDFFNTYLPFEEMESKDDLTAGDKNYCFAKEGEIYAVYLHYGGSCTLDLTNQPGDYDVKWYDAGSGGDLQDGSVTSIKGGGIQSLGQPPKFPKDDWAILVRKK